MQIINHSDFKQENVIHLALVLVGHGFTEVLRISGGQQTHLRNSNFTFVNNM